MQWYRFLRCKKASLKNYDLIVERWRRKVKGTESALDLQLIAREKINTSFALVPNQFQTRRSGIIVPFNPEHFIALPCQTVSRETVTWKQLNLSMLLATPLDTLSMFVIRYLTIDSQSNFVFFTILQKSFPCSNNQSKNIDRKPPPSTIRQIFIAFRVVN